MSHPAAPAVHLVIRSDPVAVREGLRRLFAIAPLCDLPPDAQGTAEIVLAEALNNVVEHAYAETEGEIEVSVYRDAARIRCEIVDVGLPMPGFTLPAGHLRPVDPAEQLPEGGFGWFLIRALARDLEYRRVDGCNRLRFHVATA